MWVVNQDNDSVTVFNAATNAKVDGDQRRHRPAHDRGRAERPALGDEQVSGTISLIDPTSLTVVQTLTLPFASQPFGIAFAPTGGVAFVALEATGRVLKLDAATGAVLGTVDVGPNPRHVSVNSDGTLLYASRFVTPPLPGESTAQVSAGRERWRSRRRRDRLDDREQHDHPASQRQGRLRDPGQRRAELPRRAGHLAGRRLGLGAFEAGQHPARHAAQRRQPELPEHGPRDQLEGRSRHRRGRLRRARRPRQLERRERGGLRSVRQLHVRRAGDEPRSRGRRCARPLGDLPHPGRPRAAGPRDLAGRPAPLRQQLHGPHGRRVRPVAPDEPGRDRTSRRSAPSPPSPPRSSARRCCAASSSSTTRATPGWLAMRT